MTVLEEFWVINWDGVPLFKFSPNRNLKVDLMSGFFSAIQSFAREVVDKGEDKYVSTISIGDTSYNFLNNQIYKLYFVLKSPKKIKEKYTTSFLKKLEKLFIEDFRSELVAFVSDISQFEKFQNRILQFLDIQTLSQINQSYDKMTILKSAVADVEILSRFKNRVVSNQLSPQQAIIEPQKFLKSMNTKDKLKFFTSIMPRAISTIINVRTSYKTIKNNPINPDNEASQEFIEEFEKYAYSLGIGKIGYTKVTPELVYKDSTVLFPNVIVLLIEMDEELIQKAPSFDTFKMIMGTYRDLNKSTNTLTEFLRNNNYGAQAGPSLGGVSNYVVMARNAGLGWVGRFGLLITPEFGPRQRLGLIFTNIENLPISYDNSHSWIEHYCQNCELCIRSCPGRAILEAPVVRKSGQHTHIDNKKCFPHFYDQYGCSICIKSCPFSFTKYEDLKKLV